MYLIFIAGWQCTKIHCSETDVIFLYNARIQRIEIHEQDKLVKETLLRFQNKTTCVSRPSLPRCTFLLLLPKRSIFHIIFIHLLNRFLCKQLVWYNEVLLCECMYQQEFIPFRTTTHQCPGYYIACERHTTIP